MTTAKLLSKGTLHFKAGVTTTKRWRWCLKRGDEVLILWQGKYHTKAACEDAINKVRGVDMTTPVEWHALTY